MLREKFVDKTFVEGGNTAKFAKVFTRKSFWLYIQYQKVPLNSYKRKKERKGEKGREEG